MKGWRLFDGKNSLPADLFLYAWNEVLSCSHLPSHVGLPASIMVSFYRFPHDLIPSKQRNRKGKIICRLPLFYCSYR